MLDLEVLGAVGHYHCTLSDIMCSPYCYSAHRYSSFDEEKPMFDINAYTRPGQEDHRTKTALTSCENLGWLSSGVAARA